MADATSTAWRLVGTIDAHGLMRALKVHAATMACSAGRRAATLCAQLAAVGLSRSQIANLGSRLRRSDTPDPADVALLEGVLIPFNVAMREVVAQLASAGFAATTRLKTTKSIVEKLKRTSGNLKVMQDLAGARIVRPMTLDEEDDLADRVLSLWPDAEVTDRRVVPSHGYRAVHVVPSVGGCRVEIQLRTMYQDAWAQITEVMADAFGRGIRYGEAPNTPNKQISANLTRAEFVNSWVAMSDELYRAERCENELARLVAEGQGASEKAEQLRTVIGEELGPLRKAVRDAYGSLGQQGLEGTGMVTL